MTAEAFGAMLQRHRLHAGLSQCQLARQAGLDASAVNHIERSGEVTRTGRRIEASRPRMETILSLAEALDLSVSQTDRLLYAAGLATQTDWQTRAVKAEIQLAAIRETLAENDDAAPTHIRRRTG